MWAMYGTLEVDLSVQGQGSAKNLGWQWILPRGTQMFQSCRAEQQGCKWQAQR